MTPEQDNFWETFDFRMAFISFDVHMLGRYLDMMESQLKKAGEIELSELEACLSGQNDVAEEQYEIGRRAVKQSYEQFERYQRYSFLMLAFMVFEARSKEFCRILHNDKKLSLELNNLQGNLTERLKVFLCRYAKVLEEKWAVWEELQEFQTIRNQIVHQNGICSAEDAKRRFEPMQERLPGFQVEEGAEGFQIQLSSEFCRYVVSSLERFFKEVEKKLQTSGSFATTPAT